MITRYKLMEAALQLFLDNTDEPPERNCSCHLSPPCNDCVDYSGLREAFEAPREAMEAPEDSDLKQAEIDQLRSLLSFYEQLGMDVEDQRNELPALRASRHAELMEVATIAANRWSPHALERRNSDVMDIVEQIEEARK